MAPVAVVVGRATLRVVVVSGSVVVVDDEVAFVGGIDLTLDGGDPFDTPKHPSRGQIGWHDAAIRIEED